MENTTDRRHAREGQEQGGPVSLSSLPLLIDVGTAADIGCFSRKFVRDMLREGVIEGVKVRRHWRIMRDPYLRQLGLL